MTYENNDGVSESGETVFVKNIQGSNTSVTIMKVDIEADPDDLQESCCGGDGG